MVTPHPQVPGYTVVDLLGRGGFGVVYRAVQVTVDREVAVKIDSRMVLDENDRRRFLREARAAGRLSGHPHVVDLYDAGILPDGRPYLVMELCTGGSLLDHLQKTGPMPAAEACQLGAKIADALAAAHAAGVLHRDIKPANILVNRYGVYGLADFGLAALAEPGRESSASLVALTPAYAAPEAFRQETPTERADVYALGATLYALMSGRPPRFPRTGEPNLTEIIRLHDQPVPPIAGVPDEITAVLTKALATDPADRHPTATALRDALLSATTAAPTSAAAPATPEDPAPTDPTADGSEAPDDPTTGTPSGPTRAPDTPTTAIPPDGPVPATQAATDDPTTVTPSQPEPPPVAVDAPTTDAPGLTVGFGFGPRRDEGNTLGRVVAPLFNADHPDDRPEPTPQPEPEPEPEAPRPARRLLGKAGQGAIALVAVAVLAIAGIAWAVLAGLDDDVRSPGVLDVPGSPDSADGATDILLVGSDSRTDTEGRPLPEDVLKNQLRTEQKPGTNTDTVILIRVPEDGGRAFAVSIPRDALVPIPEADEEPLNTVFAVGKQRAEAKLRDSGITDEPRLARESDSAGRQLLVQVVQQLTGIRVDRYAELNLYGFYLISEAIGGVDVCLKADTADTDSGADFKAGRRSISGADAVAFVRQRRGLPRGDLDRIVRQQTFMSAAVDKIVSADTLTNPTVVSDLTATLRRTMVIDADWDILGLARQLQDMADGNLEFTTIPIPANNTGTTPVTVDPAQVQEFIAALLTTPAPATTPPPSGTAAPAADPTPQIRPAQAPANEIPCIN